ncbi:hypothetical protein ASU33_09345 [Solirubrum puertoriconensis]|uniref:Uncharacterized protein n=1 Tax=Solirubrum puertoriconensis TaxID=1751427 RepID=A0A9X0HLX2_SOLP1|nr:hypothetical protein ASU33_09345 [Solirubrum puertoriconensis]
MTNCDFEEDKAVQYLPINPDELIYRRGDVLAFEVDSVTTGAAIVSGYVKETEDSTHIWYELVFTDYAAKQAPSIAEVKRHRLFGRKVASSLDPAGYVTCVDIESVRNDCLTDNAAKFRLVGQVALDTTRWQLGAQGASSEYGRFVQAFISGRKDRQLPPDHYDQFLSKGDKFRADEYFPVADFLVK